MQNIDQTSTVLHEHFKFESLLGEISTELVNLPLESIDTAIETSMKKLAEFFDADRCHLGEFSGDQSKIVISYFYSRSGTDIPQITENPFPPPKKTLKGKSD